MSKELSKEYKQFLTEHGGPPELAQLPIWQFGELAIKFGRALGRREVKGEAADAVWDVLVDGVSWGNDGNCGSPEVARKAIEAIPEEP